MNELQEHYQLRYVKGEDRVKIMMSEGPISILFLPIQLSTLSAPFHRNQARSIFVKISSNALHCTLVGRVESIPYHFYMLSFPRSIVFHNEEWSWMDEAWEAQREPTWEYPIRSLFPNQPRSYDHYYSCRKVKLQLWIRGEGIDLSSQTSANQLPRLTMVYIESSPSTGKI